MGIDMKSHKSRPPLRRSRLWVELLETRQLLSGFAPTAAEQLMLDQLNDIRANPVAYGNSIGLDLSGVVPAPPLAFDPLLIEAAHQHAQDMNDRGYFAHITPEGLDPGGRLTQVGFPWTSWGESSAAGSQDPTSASALAALITDAGHPDLMHRSQLLAIDAMSQTQTEVGIGVVQGGSGPLTNYYTIDTASTTDTRPFLTGVVFNDAQGSGHYAAGEGLGHIVINVVGLFNFSTVTWDSGGYSLQLNPGTYTITASGGALTAPISQTVTIGTTNVRLNFALPGTALEAGSAAWLTLLYHDLLARTPNAAEIGAWTNQLENGESHAAVASAFLGSQEYSQDLVTQWYQGYLHRAPDPTGLNAFTDALLAGQSEDAVREAIFGSQEYFNLHGATAEGLVQALYQDTLGRAPAGNEDEGWMALAASTADRAQIAAGFVTSTEAMTREAAGLYATFLRRNPDSSGLSTFVNLLSSGADQRAAVQLIVASDEYFNAGQAILWLNSLYQNILGRNGDNVAEVGAWLAVLNSGVDRTNLATALAGSVEAETRTVTTLYQRLLGKQPDPAGLIVSVHLLQAGSHVTDVVNMIVSSQAYFSRQGGSNALFISGLYRDLLSRSPLSSESTLGISELRSGTTRQQMAANITGSVEYQQDAITNLFQLYLHRPPTSAELKQYVTLRSSGASDATVIGALVGSDQYYALFAG
jgi:uncharacterized protein YkwD